MHQTYECSWCICKSKRNYLVFIETFRCNECHLVAIIHMYLYLMLTTSQIQLGENLSTMKFVNNIIDVL